MNLGTFNLPPGCRVADLDGEAPVCRACDTPVGPRAMDHDDYDDLHPMCLSCLVERQEQLCEP